MCASIVQFKLIIRLRKWYMIYYVLKYKTSNLIILYHCMYFRLSSTVMNVIWNSIKLIKSTESGPWINR